MTIHEGSDLHKRVERYEAAVEELRNAHADIRDVLLDHVLFERWEQLGTELGFSAEPMARAGGPARRDFAAINQQIPELSEAWSG